MALTRGRRAKALLSGALAGGLLAAVAGSGSAERPPSLSAPTPSATAERSSDSPASPAARPRLTRSTTSQRSAPTPPPVERWLAGFDPLQHRADGDRRVADLEGGATAVLTLDARLQEHLERELARYEVPYGALLAIEPSTGRVLAYVSHSSANPASGDLVRDATPPAASVFKIVTGAALVDAGVSPATKVCYGGGLQRLTAADLEDDPKRDASCTTLAEAMGHSTNAVFAKLASRHLDPTRLERYAAAFGFGHALPFDVRMQPSPAEMPRDRLEFARTAAGFWHMHMSPFHGALIAATVANGGEMPRPTMIDAILDAEGRPVHRTSPAVFRSVIPKTTARATAEMMKRTVRDGTASKWFTDPKGTPFLPNVEVAGKTGSLSASDPYRAYSWFVGFAPADAPKIALAALVVNTPKWRIKSSYLAREAFRNYLAR